jgi:glucosamine-6-phosphate deaminase
MRLVISNHDVGVWAAHYILNTYQQFQPSASKPLVIALPTGATAVSIYHQLINLYKLKLISFQHIITFNLDEYVGISKDHPLSYHRYMYEHVFNHIDIQQQNINILNGMATDLELECKTYEEKITAVGGIDLLICGIGVNGHIAFNEPFSSFSCLTKITNLDIITRKTNASLNNVDLNIFPKQALTMGMQTIMAARDIVVSVKGINKANVLAQIIEGPISSMVPASILQQHLHSVIVCDQTAISELKIKTLGYFENITDKYNQIEQQITYYNK